MENNKPLVSVIISSYNHEDYIEKAIECIVNQSYGYENIEIIAFDDCSPDNTGKKLLKLSKKYNFSFTQNTENKGLVKNRNLGLKLAKGKYVCGCGSDDYWHLERIHKQVEFMESNPEFGMCYGKVFFVKEDDITPDPHNNYKGGHIFKDILLLKYHMPAPTYMIRRDVFEVVGFYNENLRIEDWYMSLKIADKYAIGFMNEHLSYYRIHDTNVSRNLDLIYDNQWQILSEYKDNPLYQKALNNYYLRKFYLYSKFRKSEAWNIFFKAAKKFYKPEFILGVKQLLFYKEGKKVMYKS